MSIFSQAVDIVTDMECPICTEMSRDGHMVQSPYLGPNLVYVGPHCSRCHRRIEGIEEACVLRPEEGIMAEIRRGTMDVSQLDDFRNYIRLRRQGGAFPLRAFEPSSL